MANPAPHFRPAPSSEIYGHYAAHFNHTHKHNRRELLGWSFLGITVLALAGVMALLVAMSRIPGIEQLTFWPIGFFQKGLVVHVIFSFIVWFFAVFGALLCISSARSNNSKLGCIIVSLVIIASIILAVPAFIGDGTASLNNYVPTIIDPMFYAGLLILGAALSIQVLRLLTRRVFQRDQTNLCEFMITLAAILFCIALTCLAIAGNNLWDETLSQVFNEHLFWGFGHILQFSNVALLMAAWVYLANICGINLAPTTIKIAGGILLLGALTAPLFFSFYEPFSAAQQLAFTNLQYIFAPATSLIVAVILLAIIRHGRPYPWRNPAFLTLTLSISVFSIGGILGLFVDGADTRTPAHYHGVIAGINLAFMGLYYTLFLPLLDKAIAITKIIYLQVGLFAGGQTMASIGLFLAGGYGVPRKVAGADQGLEIFGAYAGMMMNGIGALIAIIGGILFIWSMAHALLKTVSAP
jgi:cytochrome c oxidase subunit 1